MQNCSTLLSIFVTSCPTSCLHSGMSGLNRSRFLLKLRGITWKVSEESGEQMGELHARSHSAGHANTYWWILSRRSPPRGNLITVDSDSPSVLHHGASVGSLDGDGHLAALRQAGQQAVAERQRRLQE